MVQSVFMTLILMRRIFKFKIYIHPIHQPSNITSHVNLTTFKLYSLQSIKNACKFLECMPGIRKMVVLGRIFQQVEFVCMFEFHF